MATNKEDAMKKSYKKAYGKIVREYHRLQIQRRQSINPAEIRQLTIIMTALREQLHSMAYNEGL